jgi:hypothetical protein
LREWKEEVGKDTVVKKNNPVKYESLAKRRNFGRIISV